MRIGTSGRSHQLRRLPDDMDCFRLLRRLVRCSDFLLTWNCVHIANATIAKDIAKICRQYDWECPVICTPEELF